MASSTELPTVAVFAVEDGHWLVQCPYCGIEHRHGAAVGVRVAHCHRGDYRILAFDQGVRASEQTAVAGVTAAMERLDLAEAAAAGARVAMLAAVRDAADSAYKTGQPRVIVAALRDLYWNCPKLSLKEVLDAFGVPRGYVSQVSALVGPFESAARPCYSCGGPMTLWSRSDLLSYDGAPNAGITTRDWRKTECDPCLPPHKRHVGSTDIGRKQTLTAMLWAELERRDVQGTAAPAA